MATNQAGDKILVGSNQLGGATGPRPHSAWAVAKGIRARLGVDPTTLARWERGEREPRGTLTKRAMQLFPVPEDQRAPILRAG